MAVRPLVSVHPETRINVGEFYLIRHWRSRVRRADLDPGKTVLSF